MSTSLEIKKIQQLRDFWVASCVITSGQLKVGDIIHSKDRVQSFKVLGFVMGLRQYSNKDSNTGPEILEVTLGANKMDNVNVVALNTKWHTQ